VVEEVAQQIPVFIIGSFEVTVFEKVKLIVPV
jgi:hypothetical protein